MISFKRSYFLLFTFVLTAILNLPSNPAQAQCPNLSVSYFNALGNNNDSSSVIPRDISDYIGFPTVAGYYFPTASGTPRLNGLLPSSIPAFTADPFGLIFDVSNTNVGSFVAHGAGPETAEKSSVSPNGDHYIAGVFSNDFINNFETNFLLPLPGQVSAIIHNNFSNSGQEVYIRKNSSGSPWTRVIGKASFASAGSVALGEIVADNTGIYITGSFQGSINFNSTGSDIRSSVNPNFLTLFTTKYDVNGVYQWTYVPSSLFANITTTGTSIDVDSSTNNVFIGGSVGSITGTSSALTMNFGLPSGNITNPPSTFTNGLVIGLSTSGGNPTTGWVVSSSATIDTIIDLKAKNGSVYLAGNNNAFPLPSSVQFAPTNLGIPSTTANVDYTQFFVARYNNTFTPTVSVLGGGNTINFLREILVNNCGDINILGDFYSYSAPGTPTTLPNILVPTPNSQAFNADLFVINWPNNSPASSQCGYNGGGNSTDTMIAGDVGPAGSTVMLFSTSNYTGTPPNLTLTTNPVAVAVVTGSASCPNP